MAYVRHRYRIVAIDVLLSFNFAVVFILMYFHSRDAWRTEKKIREIKFGKYRRYKFGPHCLLAQDALLH